MLSDTDIVNCPIKFTLQIWRRGKPWRVTVFIPLSETEKLTISEVGTSLQRQVYEALRQALQASIEDQDL